MEENQQALWNFDAAESFIIFQIKAQFISYLREWNLEQAYWTLRELRRELDAKLVRDKKKIIKDIEEDQLKNKNETKKQTEKEMIDSLMTELEKEREEFSKDPSDENKKSKFFLSLEESYMQICYVMKKHGLYFREGEDSRTSILRR